MLKNKFKKERSPLVDIEEINKVHSRFSKVNQMISPSIQQTRDAQKKAINEDVSIPNKGTPSWIPQWMSLIF